jgi:hypothetical protein
VTTPPNGSHARAGRPAPGGGWRRRRRASSPGVSEANRWAAKRTKREVPPGAERDGPRPSARNERFCRDGRRTDRARVTSRPKSELAGVDRDALSVRLRDFEPAVHIRPSDLLGRPTGNERTSAAAGGWNVRAGSVPARRGRCGAQYRPPSPRALAADVPRVDLAESSRAQPRRKVLRSDRRCPPPMLQPVGGSEN